MNKNSIARRIEIVATACVRNAAYYRAMRSASTGKIYSEFEKTILNNFIDTAFLEWSKLFVDAKSKHHWTRVINDKLDFEISLYAATSMPKDHFQSYENSVKLYRDKFLAHLDYNNIMNIPSLEPAINSACLLMDHIKINQAGGNHEINHIDPSISLYRDYFDQAFTTYKILRK